jgi:hypothetical protein
MSTSPFSAIGESDFLAPGLYGKDEACKCPKDYAQNLLAHNNRSPDPNPPITPNIAAFPSLLPCERHGCCVVWRRAQLCEWGNTLGLNPFFAGPQLNQGPVTVCPNRWLVHEFQPLEMLMEPSVAKEGAREEQGEGQAAPWNGRPPVFPSTEMYYTEDTGHILQAPHPLSLEWNRHGVEDAGHMMWRERNLLAEHIATAEREISMVEQRLASGGDPKRSVANMKRLKFFLLRLDNLIRPAVFTVAKSEERVAEAYRYMMFSMTNVLAAQQKLPVEGQSITSPDGSYTVSWAELDLYLQDTRAVINSCDGPLKQADRLKERLEALYTFRG